MRTVRSTCGETASGSQTGEPSITSARDVLGLAHGQRARERAAAALADQHDRLLAAVRRSATAAPAGG